MQAIDEIVPTLLHALEDDEMFDIALDGLKQILSVRTTAVLPHILPKLVHLPLSAFNTHALGALAEVAGPGLDLHLGIVLPALLAAMGGDDMEVKNLAKKAAETVVLVIDEEGTESLISELLKGIGDNQGLISGSAELREQAALGLGESIEVISEQALKEFVIPITGLISGSVELREQAALVLGELIEVTSEQALKEFVIPIMGGIFCLALLQL